MVFEERIDHSNETPSQTQPAEHPADNAQDVSGTAESTSTEPQLSPAAPVSSSEPTETPNSERPGSGSMVNEKELTEDFATALETFTAEQAAEAAASEDRVIKGTVVKITPTHVVVDAGFKSEGMVPIAEVQDHEGNVRFQPGDEIEVMVDKGETEEGYTRLSHQKAQRLRAWDEIEKAYNDKVPIQATVVERIKGGLTVDIMGARAFLPGSQLDVRPVRNLDAYKAEQFEVRVIKLNKKRGNIVVSRKQLIEEEVSEKRGKDPGALERGRGAYRNRQEPDRVRRIRGSRRHRRSVAHHRHVLGTAHSSPRSGAGWRSDPGQGSQVRQR